MQVAHLSLPLFESGEHSLEDVSFREDSCLHRVRPLDLSQVDRPAEGSAALSGTISKNRVPLWDKLLPQPPRNSPALGSSAAVQAAEDSDGCPMQATDSIVKSEHVSARLNQHASHHKAATARFNMPNPTDLVSLDQAGKPVQSTKSWRAAGTAREPLSLHSNRAAVQSWQQTLIGASAHEQWAMQRQGSHGRMSEAGENEDWGELTLQLPKGARPSVDQLLQQLPEALRNSVNMCTVAQVTLLYPLLINL